MGHVGLVKLLAAQHGPLMHTQRSTLLANALRNAAQNGHLPVLRQLEALGIIRIGNETHFDKDKAENRERIWELRSRFNLIGARW